MKKVKSTTRRTTLRPDDSKPAKVPAPATTKRASSIESYVRETNDGAPRKPTGKKAVVQSAGKANGRAKEPVAPAATKRPRSSKPVEHGEQQPRRARGTNAGTPNEQYVRLLIRVRDGRLSIADSHLVDGPLGQPRGFPGTNAYEVTLGDELLHGGSLPDLGVQRAFVNPDGPPEEHGHHFTERTAYEFTARVPAAAVTPDTIGKIVVTLHRIKEEARGDQVGAVPLRQQFEREVRPIAELVGLPASVLPEAIEKRGGRTPTV